MRTCPLCGCEFNEPPALSRMDDHSEICPRCGRKQALEAAGFRPEVIEEILDAMYSECDHSPDDLPSLF